MGSKKNSRHQKQSLLKKFDLKQYLHEKRRLTRLRQRLYGPIAECDTKERLLQDERKRRQQKLVKKMVYGLSQNRVERYQPKNLWQAKQKRTEKSQRQRKLRYQHRNDNAFFSPALYGVKFKIRKSRAEFLRQGKPKLAASSTPLTNLFSIVGRLTQWEGISLNYPDDIPDFEFPPKDVLDIIGIEATEVGLSNGVILFNPCFFRPYPQEEQSLLEKFPIEDNCPIPLTLVPPDQTEESAKEDMRIQRMMYPSEKAAKREYLFDQEGFDLGMAEWRRERPGAYCALHHVQDHLFIPRRKVNREGVREKPSNLLSRTKWREVEIDACFPESRGCELEVSTYYRWELIRSYDYSESAHRNRHMILTISSHIDVDDGQGLCFHELCVCVNAMTHVVLNGNHPCGTLPLLVLSFLGNHNGRIIQVTFDGESLRFQYSKLWNFLTRDTISLELFLRYHMSQAL